MPRIRELSVVEAMLPIPIPASSEEKLCPCCDGLALYKVLGSHIFSFLCAFAISHFNSFSSFNSRWDD